jgi:hypothetical protein
MASSKALSTNVGHYKALTLAAQLAREQGDTARARYDGLGADLKRAINRRLWLDDAGMYSSLTAAHFDGAPMHKFDWLGQSLAIVTGVADGSARAKHPGQLSARPDGRAGDLAAAAGMPVYHNRAMWPFVTAYGLRAAVAGRNVRGRRRLRHADARRGAEPVEHGKPGVAVRPAAAAGRSAIPS